MADQYFLSVMKIVYNLGILLYKLMILLASPFNEKARLFREGRKGVFEYLKQEMDPKSNYIWFHAASLGEFEQGRPLMERIRKDNLDYKIILTFFSPSGYEVRKNYDGADIVCYLPMDTSWEARKFIKIVRPSIAVFVKYEFWLNYLTELKEHKIPTYIVSAIFRESQAFFKWYGGWYCGFLRNFKHLFVQDKKSVELLASVGIHDVTIAGDTRFDRVAEIVRQAKELPVVEAFKGNSRVLIAGSSWPKDEDLFIEYFNNNENLKLIIAPHVVSESHIEEIIGKLKRPCVRFTKTNEEEAAKADCMIIDCIGLLSAIYRYGEVAYIGGGFGVGIHNILEAAVYGMPVIFGPNYQKFREAVEMEKVGAAFPIHCGNCLKKVLDELFAEDTSKLNEVSAKAQEFVSQNCGASDLIMQKIFGK